MSDLKGKALWLVVEATCTLLPDAQVVSTAKWATMKKNGHAARHLQHFLTGGGKNLPVDLRRVFKEDPKVEKHVVTQIVAGLKTGKKSGRIPVAQKVYGNKDWWFAIGSMNVSWKMKKKGVAEVFFKNKYQWHTNEKRITKCVHEAAANLKVKARAADYWMIGRPIPVDLKKATARWGRSQPAPEIFEVY